MRGGILTLLLVALAVLAAVGMADSEPQEVAVDADSDLVVEEETLEAQPETEATLDEADAVPVQEIDPRLTPEAIEKVFSKMSAKCLKQVQENPTDPTKVSDRCRAEVARRIQRYLERLDKEEKGETEEKKTEKNAKKPKRRSRKSKKQSRAQREAAAAQKKEEEYQQTLQTILGFVATFVAIIAGAMFYINRKLKAAGMYFPDPDAKATCCN
ncbi:Mitochondrial substrate carrier family protein B [Phytophthora cinnamomi]|uniref:Mitochondrial substrate carrier family protein B n=1 Tax=Phytophthora cinnamomi TaxID=4785 RepID=UPI00355A4CF4|nr:Mitochondrial substrate carrier family protein B [Phytophthora cinnamomi]